LEELKVYLEGNYNLVSESLEKHLPEVKIPRLEATYLLWMDFRAWGMNQHELKSFMAQKAGLGLNDGNTFGREGRGFMRMNLASPRSVIADAMQRIVEARQQQ
jgi:cystathionine beta-lyase